MRAIWTGAIAFGLVNVPVKAYGATEDHDVQLHQVHDADGGRIRYQRRCEVCGEKVDFEHIDKAYDDGERTVVLTDEDFDALPSEKSREIEVVQFVPNAQIDPIMLERSYYLEPDSKSPKAYLLLRKTLEDSELTAVVKFALRQKTRIGALRVRGKVLVLQTLLWGDEVREVDFPATNSRVRISDQELKMSAMLVEQFSGDFAPKDFEDEYQSELRTLIEAKLTQGDSLDTGATFGDADAVRQDAGRDSGDVIDLMEALKRSIEGKRTRRSGAGTAATGKTATGKDAAGGKTRAVPSGKTGAKTTAKAAGKTPAKSPAKTSARASAAAEPAARRRKA